MPRNLAKWGSKLAHIAHGLLAGLLSINFIQIAVFLFVQFLAYEYFEETKVRDELYHELREWALGYVAGLAAILALRYLST